MSLADPLLILSALLWVIAAIVALRQWTALSRGLLVAGTLSGIAAAVFELPDPTHAIVLPVRLAGEAVTFRLEPEALWLMGFGLAPAAFACALMSPSTSGRGGWLFGVALSLIGALGVFGLQNGAALLVAWEIMSLGGAVMILSERLEASRGRTVLFMLALLEVGSVALLLAVAILGLEAGSLDFAQFGARAPVLSTATQTGVGLLLLVGFGAKLGLLPFYEWFPGAYGSGSGASGAILSGVVLNAAFFGLARGLMNWLPATPDNVFPLLSVIVIVIATISAILTILYAFQQDDWRQLLSLSSAENASVAVVILGAAMLFRSYGLQELAGLAWTVALLHLAGHALAKGTLFTTADGLQRSTATYAITASGAGSDWVFGVGSLIAAMSLAAMPPTAGFVSEWFVFQSVFQGFHLPNLGGRLVLALTGAGLALTVAVAFATFAKVIGISVLGREKNHPARIPQFYSVSVGFLGLAVLAVGAGMPVWLSALDGATQAHFGSAVSREMRSGLLLVPLTAKFAFISPSLLVIVMPLLSLVPLGLILASRRLPVRRTRVWYGGLPADPTRASTTALTFSNAMRTFYSFVYRPTADIERDADVDGYFVKKLVFEHDVAPIFGPLLFQPAERIVDAVARKLRVLQSGYLNVYLGLIGLLLLLVLGLTLA
jgi:formate hydrogenlyase subunit 3/multisubunit Na+/H+ antiporter MnhD subunit